jgi:hypothetical protein
VPVPGTSLLFDRRSLRARRPSVRFRNTVHVAGMHGEVVPLHVSNYAVLVTDVPDPTVGGSSSLLGSEDWGEQPGFAAPSHGYARFNVCAPAVQGLRWAWKMVDKGLQLLVCVARAGGLAWRCCDVLRCCAVLCCAVLCCAVLCCAVLCCAVLCCAVLCCAVLCCAALVLPLCAAARPLSRPSAPDTSMHPCLCCVSRATQVALVLPADAGGPARPPHTLAGRQLPPHAQHARGRPRHAAQRV